MQSIAYIQASDGVNNASMATVQNTRSAGATTNIVNTVSGFPQKFYASMGTPHTFTDPQTGETITIISEATARDFAGHLDAGKIEIDAFAPGQTDIGSQVGDIIVVRPVTEWSNNIHNILSQSHNDDGSLKDSAIVYNPLAPDHVASGCVITGTGYGSTLAWSMTAGVVYINGKRYTVAAASGVVVASKDTYFDVLAPGSGSVASLVYTGGNSVANNAASPALAANSLRIGIIQSGANIASVAAINQGQTDKLLPIVGGFPYIQTDSLGNRICRRNPFETVRGYRSKNHAGAVIPNAYTDYHVVTANFAGRSVDVDYGAFVKDGSSGAVRTGHVRVVVDGVALTDSDLIWSNPSSGAAALPRTVNSISIPQLSAGVHTIKLQVQADTASASLLYQAYLRVTEP